MWVFFRLQDKIIFYNFFRKVIYKIAEGFVNK